MGLKIHEYPLERFSFGDDDFYDIDYWDGVTYQTAKIKGSVIKAGITASVIVNNLYNSDGTLTTDRVVTMDGYNVKFDGGASDGVVKIKGTNSGVVSFLRGTDFVAWNIAKDVDGNENLMIARHDGTGGYLDTPFQISIVDGSITFNGAYTFPTTDGTSGQYLATDGLGNITWQTLASAINIYNSDGTLTGNRIVTGANFELFFQSIGGFIVHSHVNNMDNVVFEVRSDPTWHGFIVKDHNTGVHMLACRNGLVEISDAYFLPGVDGTPGQYLETDGAGNVSWQTLPSAVNIYNADGSLTATRTLNLNGQTLFVLGANGQIQFSNGNQLFVEGTGANQPSVILNAPNNVKRNFQIRTSGINRWELTIEDNETGLEQGANFVIQGYDDAGSPMAKAFKIRRVDGAITFNEEFTFPTSDGLAGQVLQTNGAGIVQWVTPAVSANEKRIGQDYAYNLSPAGGYTWNGIANVGATTITTLQERTRLQAFAGAGQPDGCFTNFVLPSTYISGNSIKVTCNVTENGTGGDIKFWVGLAKPSAGAYTAGNTQWLSDVHTAVAGFPVVSFTLTFTGTGLNAGDPIGILVFRDPGDVQDTYGGDSYLNVISVEQL